MQAVLLCCQDNDIEQWVLFPDINGNLYLDLKSDRVDAGVVLSDKSFSYFADDKDKKEEVFMRVLRSINKIAA